MKKILEKMTTRDLLVLADYIDLADSKIYKLLNEIDELIFYQSANLLDETRWIDQLDEMRTWSEEEKYRWSVIKLLLSNNINKHIMEDFYDFLIELKKKSISFVTIVDDIYPLKLKNSIKPPIVLYYKGNIKPLLSMATISIVGSRTPDEYGIKACQFFTESLIVYNIGIISGLALGIDAVAHKSALSGKAYTVAVLGSSVDNITPKSNLSLANGILSAGGCIISEYKPGSKVMRSNYVVRNKIVANISDASLIIQGTEKSGSIKTANFCLEGGKNLYALPGLIFNRLSEGPNMLINQGAILALHPKNIIDDLSITNENIKKIKKDTCKTHPIYDNLNSDCKNLVSILESNPPMDLDKIYQLTKLDIGTIVSCLNMMELKGLVIRVGTDKFTLTS